MSNDSPSGRSAEAPGSRGSRPRALTVAAVVLGVEGLAAALLGLVEVVSTAGDRLAMGLSTAVFLILYGVGLGLVGWGLHRVATWSRGPAVFSQLIQLGVAWSFRGGSTTWVAILLALLAVVALVAIFQRSSTEALADRPRV